VSKGPTFVPTPINYDWLELQKDFDNFKNKMRARYYFNQNNKEFTSLDSSNIQKPPKKTSTWKAPKSKSPELETFLSNVERSLFW